jgi:hypothetical protein
LKLNQLANPTTRRRGYEVGEDVSIILKKILLERFWIKKVGSFRKNSVGLINQLSNHIQFNYWMSLQTVRSPAQSERGNYRTSLINLKF